MKKLLGLLACVSLSAQAFVCGGTIPHKVLEDSEHGLLGQITNLDRLPTIHAKKTYAGIRSELFANPALDDFSEDVLSEYHRAIIDYKGQPDFYSIKDYVEALPYSETAKQGAFDMLVYGLRKESFTNTEDGLVLNGFVNFANSLIHDVRFMPTTPEILNFAIPGNTCSGGRCVKASMSSSCDPWTCR